MGDMSRKCEHGDYHAYCAICSPDPKDERIKELEAELSKEKLASENFSRTVGLAFKQLEAKVAELQKDANRYKFIKDNLAEFKPKDYNGCEYARWDLWYIKTDTDNLDTAIDEAMKGEKE